MNTNMTFIQRHSLAIFFGSSVGLGWLLTFLVSQVPASPVVLPLVALPISYIPAVVALILLRVSRDDEERRLFRQRLILIRVGVQWYVVGFLALPVAYLAGVALATVRGGAFPFHPSMFVLLPLFLVTNIGEEIGWRGYALPRLLLRFNALVASLLLGFVWGAFHWVAFLQNPETPWAYVGVSTLYLMPMSVLMTFVFNQTGGSVPLMALMHGSFDTVSIAVAPLIETRVPLLAFTLGAAVTWVFALGLVLVTGKTLSLKSRTRLPTTAAG